MCTIFRYKNFSTHQILKNYDVPSPCYGLLFWNPEGIKKRALIKPPEEPVVWISKYGNITFNQVGRDFPASGMNEKGLVVEQTTLWNTMYPDKDNRKAIKELQLIQYLLDVCSTTNEALEHLATVRVSQEMARLQYVIADKEGDISLVEFVLGEMNVYSNTNFAYQTITNDMIGTSLDYLHTHIGFGGVKKVQSSKYSLDRFVVTIDALQRTAITDCISSGFELLNLSKYEDTQWQIIYDLNSMSIQWRTKDNDNIFELLLADFVNTPECLIIEVDTTKPDKYTKTRNEILVNRLFRESDFFRGIRINDKDIDALVSWSEST